MSDTDLAALIAHLILSRFLVLDKERTIEDLAFARILSGRLQEVIRGALARRGVQP